MQSKYIIASSPTKNPGRLTDVNISYCKIFSQQWFHMYAPMRLDAVLQENKSQISVASSNSLDISKVFRGKSDKKYVCSHCPRTVKYFIFLSTLID